MMFKPSGVVPNNPHLPALLYRSAFPKGSDLASTIEGVFAANGWPPQWRNGIFPFHHYHCEGHEVLGIAAGEAELLLGGKDGSTVAVKRGDAVLLPAGTGHCRLAQSTDFLVIGAYPHGQHADIQRGEASTSMLRTIAVLPYPTTDPLGDSDGVPKLWPIKV